MSRGLGDVYKRQIHGHCVYTISLKSVIINKAISDFNVK